MSHEPLFNQPIDAKTLNVKDLLPQTGPMRLIDEVLAVSDGFAKSSTTLSKDKSLFITPEGRFEGAALIEIMAQTIGLFAGLRHWLKGHKPKLGLLLGTRKFDLLQSDFAFGSVIETTINCLFQDEDGLWQFDCECYLEQNLVASATLTVYDPPEAYLNDLLQRKKQ